MSKELKWPLPHPESAGLTVSLGFLWQFFPLLQGLATSTTHEALNQVSTSDLAGLSLATIITSISIGTGVQLKTINEKGVSADPFCNVLYSQTKRPYFSCSCGLVMGLLAVNLSDTMSAAGYLSGDEGRMFWAGLTAKYLASTLVSVGLNTLIAKGKLDFILQTSAKLRSNFTHKYSLDEISYLPDIGGYSRNRSSVNNYL